MNKRRELFDEDKHCSEHCVKYWDGTPQIRPKHVFDTHLSGSDDDCWDCYLEDK